MTAVQEEERKYPDENVMIKSGINGVGGNCIIQNAFLMLLLKALRFDAFIVSGMFKGPGSLQDNHVICVVRLNIYELYLLHLGMDLPLTEPVPLHNLPYINRAAGCRYLHRQAKEAVYERVQLDGALFGDEYENRNTECERYDFTLKPKTIEFFKKPFSPIQLNQGFFKVSNEI